VNSDNSKGVVLVTGASSGLGARTAQLLAEQGYRVAGAARRVRQIPRTPGIEPVWLDLTDEASIAEAVAATQRECGPIEILVNSAGYGEFGSFEETSTHEARHQFEVNVFGLAALTRHVLGPMREAQRGRIVNVSSLAGEFSSPLAGWYHASKFALEALSDSLRNEVRKFGIGVTVVQPGPVRTAWHDDALAHLTGTSGHGAYATLAQAVARYHRATQETSIASDIDDVAAVIVHAATVADPRPRYRVGRGANLAVAFSRLPDRIFDAMTRRIRHRMTNPPTVQTVPLSGIAARTRLDFPPIRRRSST
jgi:short-subunit dehydrogenase